MIYQLKLMLAASLIMIGIAAAAMRTTPANASWSGEKADQVTQATLSFMDGMDCYNAEIKLKILELKPKKTKLIKRKIAILKYQIKLCNEQL